MNQNGCSTNSQVVWPKFVDHHRLRVFLEEPLFYHERHKMCPSVYTCQLAPNIAKALAGLNRHLSPVQSCEPLKSRQSVQIAMKEYTAFCIFPGLMNKLQCKAPHLNFELRYLPHNPALNELLAGEIDLAPGSSEPGEIRHPDLDEIDVFSDEFVLISNKVRSSLPLGEYLVAGHAME